LGRLSAKEENRHVLINHVLEEEPEVEYVKKLCDDLNVSLKAGRVKGSSCGRLLNLRA